jgi:hypothetical protein
VVFYRVSSFGRISVPFGMEAEDRVGVSVCSVFAPSFLVAEFVGESVPVCAPGALVSYIIFLLAAYGQAEKEVKRQRKVREGWAKHFSQQAPPHPQSIPRPDLPPGAEVFSRKAPTTPSLPPEIMDLFRRLQSLRAMTVGRGCTMSEAVVARNKARAIEAELTRWAKANG